MDQNIRSESVYAEILFPDIGYNCFVLSCASFTQLWNTLKLQAHFTTALETVRL